MSNKTVDAKRKIISSIRNRDSKEALKLFFKVFTNEKPAELEFIKNVYVELNKLSLHKENFEFLEKIASGFTNDLDFQDIFENATKIYVDNLILKANNISFERLEKEKALDESLKRADSLTREKMQVENNKQLSILNEKAKELYKLAAKYSPKNLSAHRGWLECCKIAGNKEETELVEKKIEDFSHSVRDKAKISKENISNEQSKDIDCKKVYLDKETYNKLESLFEAKKYSTLIEEIEKLSVILPIPADILILKARSLVELKRFKEADKTIFEAERLNTHFLEIKQAKEEISAIKHKLYVKAGGIFLQKGIKLGVGLGTDNFKKAKTCLMKALEINPDNLDLLDQAHSALKYLGENEEAFKIKAAIHSIEPTYPITYDNRYNQTLCFIATFAFYEKPAIIDDFRWFRREYMLNNGFGRRLNSLYVTLSHKITKAAQNKELLRYLFKLMLYFPLLFVRVLKVIKKDY